MHNIQCGGGEGGVGPLELRVERDAAAVAQPVQRRPQLHHLLHVGARLQRAAVPAHKHTRHEYKQNTKSIKYHSGKETFFRLVVLNRSFTLAKQSFVTLPTFR